MKSLHSPVVSIPFDFSGVCSELSNDFTDLAADAGHHLILSHQETPAYWPPFESFQETIQIYIRNVEYRMTIDLLVDRKIETEEFQELVGLIIATVKKLFEANEYSLFQSINLSGFYKSATFRSWWTWYSFINGVAKACSETLEPYMEL